MPNDDLTTVVIPTQRRKVIWMILYTTGLVLVTSAITIPVTIHLTNRIEITTTTTNSIVSNTTTTVIDSTTTVTVTTVVFNTTTTETTVVISTTTAETTVTSTISTTTIMETSTIPIITTTPVTELLCYMDTSTSPKWIQDGITVAGGNGQGNDLNQLDSPWGLYLDDNQTLYIADSSNHRIVEWKNGATIGRIIDVSGGQENLTVHLGKPLGMVFDQETGSFIICDAQNLQVIRWPRQNGNIAEVIITNVDCTDLAIDDNGYIYVPDFKQHEVRRWKIGDSNGTIVAGGNGCGSFLNQTCHPQMICVDQDYSVYVVDNYSHRVTKWMKDTQEGILITPPLQPNGNVPIYLNRILGIAVDDVGAIYIIDHFKQRIMRWFEDTQPCIVVGGNGMGNQANQFNMVINLFFDRQGNLYVSDRYNYRVQKFNINSQINDMDKE